MEAVPMLRLGKNSMCTLLKSYIDSTPESLFQLLAITITKLASISKLLIMPLV